MRSRVHNIAIRVNKRFHGRHPGRSVVVSVLCALLLVCSLTVNGLSALAEAEQRAERVERSEGLEGSVFAVLEGSLVKESVSVRFREAELRDVLNLLAQQGEFNLVLDPSVKGSLSLDLTNVPLEKALSYILSVSGLKYYRDEETNTLLVSASTIEGYSNQSVLRTFVIKHRLAASALAHLQQTLLKHEKPLDGLPLSVSQDSGRNALFVSGASYQVAQVVRFLKEYDVPQQQVALELSLVLLSANERERLSLAAGQKVGILPSPSIVPVAWKNTSKGTLKDISKRSSKALPDSSVSASSISKIRISNLKVVTASGRSVTLDLSADKRLDVRVSVVPTALQGGVVDVQVHSQVKAHQLTVESVRLAPGETLVLGGLTDLDSGQDKTSSDKKTGVKDDAADELFLMLTPRVLPVPAESLRSSWQGLSPRSLLKVLRPAPQNVHLKEPVNLEGEKQPVSTWEAVSEKATRQVSKRKGVLNATTLVNQSNQPGEVR